MLVSTRRRWLRHQREPVLFPLPQPQCFVLGYRSRLDCCRRSNRNQALWRAPSLCSPCRIFRCSRFQSNFKHPASPLKLFHVHEPITLVSHPEALHWSEEGLCHTRCHHLHHHNLLLHLRSHLFPSPRFDHSHNVTRIKWCFM